MIGFIGSSNTRRNEGGDRMLVSDTTPLSSDYLIWSSVHRFTNTSVFYVNQPIAIEYVIISGGGGGGPAPLGIGAGGGGGGYITGTTQLSTGSYSIIIGSGGVAGSNGSTTTFLGISASGGGRGGSQNGLLIAGIGGSGGGSVGGTASANFYVPGAVGVSSQGSSGGRGAYFFAASPDPKISAGYSLVTAAGGGGAGNVGGDALLTTWVNPGGYTYGSSSAGFGGIGRSFPRTGSSTSYAGGGGGSGGTYNGLGQSGGGNGGSNGYLFGGGGGGGGAGAPGVLFIRYKQYG
jgi:hypothetical protein